MATKSRKSFSYAPLRVTSGMLVKPQLEVSVLDWHEVINQKSLMAFDMAAMILFTMIGLGMTWTSRHWSPPEWYNHMGMGNEMGLSGLRLGVVGFVTALSATGLVLANRFKWLELPWDQTVLTGLKLLATAMLSWGVLFSYHDPIVGLIPMAGLTLISVMLLFRIDLDEAVKMSVYLGLIGMPIVFSGWVI